MKCRHCQAELERMFLDLGTAPPSNAYLTREQLDRPERHDPLRVRACTRCWLVQAEDHAAREDLFASHYAYFSSYSSTWLAHAERYVDAMVERLGLDARSHVVEVASNDGYLLQYVQRRGIPCLGIEPTAGTAEAARARGIETRVAFFGRTLAAQLAQEGRAADLMVANNVLAHVPDIVDFAAGFAQLLRPHGVATFEFPHLLRLVEECQFDTVYHEHYSYLSLVAVERIFGAAGLAVFDVEELPTHGGSLRVHAQRADSGRRPRTGAVAALLGREERAGLASPRIGEGLQARAERIKDDVLLFLIEQKRARRTVCGYGAAAKGSTLLNFAGVRTDLLPCVADASPHKQGRFLPGSRIPIVDVGALRARRPDFVLVLPWNLKDEIAEQLRDFRAWGARFVTAIPELAIA